MGKLFSKFKVMFFLVTSIVTLTLTLMGNAVADTDVLARVLDRGVLKVAMTGDQPPFNVVSRSKDVIGYDVDLANSFANAMMVKLEIVKLPFGELMSSLTSGKVDMIISGMAITGTRTKDAIFVGPYTVSGKSMLTTKAVMEKIKGQGFNKEGIRLLALDNSTSETFAQKGLPNASLTAISNYDEGIKLILAGKADALVADMPICKLTVLRNPNSGLVTSSKPLSIEPVGIAVAKNDPQFENLVRNYLTTFEKVGVTKRFQQKWFENSNWIVALP